jgi:hypothetical protein
MDPITVIVSALAAGAAAGLKDAAATGIKDAYAALKRLIADRYDDVDVTPVEKRPESEAKRRSLEEDLRDAGAGHDDLMLDAARRVIEEVRSNDAGTGAAIGIDLERVQAAALRIRDVAASGGGVRVREGSFRGDIDIEGVRAGRPDPPRP